MLRVTLAVFLCLPIFTHAESLPAHVSRVSDGDTIEVVYANGRHDIVRLANIDAPETSCHQSNQQAYTNCEEVDQPYGKEAKNALTEMILGHDITLDIADNKKQYDKYHRMVARIRDSGVDINLKMVEKGFAWFYRRYGC